MKENKTIIKQDGDNSRVYCEEDYAQEAYDMYMTGKVVSKDLTVGNLSKVIDFALREDGEVEAICENHSAMYFDVGKERKFFELINLDPENFNDWVESGSHKRFLNENDTFIQMQNTRVQKGSLYTAHLTSIRQEFKEQINNPTKAYIAKIIDKNKGGFIVSLQGINAFMPGSLAAANKITDFNEYINKEINVMIEGYMQTSDMFVVSYKKYLSYILPSKLAELEKDSAMVGTVTGANRYGIFAEFDDIFTGLLHTTEMSPETLALFNARQIVPGMQLNVWLKDINSSEQKLVLSEIDPVLRQKEIHDFRNENEGTKCEATIISIKPHGALLKMENSNIGLLPIREVKRCTKRLVVGETMKVYIKTVDTDTGKIYFTLNE